MKHIFSSLRMLLVMTLILGLGYPLLMTGISKGIFSKQADGSLIRNGQGTVIGSELIGQKFEDTKYFWGRPSAVDSNPLPSGGSNLAPTSEALKKLYQERFTKLQAAHPDQTGEVPQDLLFASGSGLDPHISLEAARYQAKRVAQARGLEVEKIQALITKTVEGRQLGFLGEERVNVLKLNLALDQ